MKRSFLKLFAVLIVFSLSGCVSQQGDQTVFDNLVSNDDYGIATIAVEPLTGNQNSPGPTTAPELAAATPAEFVPIEVEEFGISTVVPADWPPIEGDPLLKNAWGPGEFRFVAFHSVPGQDARPAMAQLLNISLDELVEDLPEGEYWEERIGNYDWSLYNVDNPDIGLGQSVAMTMQGGTIYIVSLFVEIEYRDAILNAVLENFLVEGTPVNDMIITGEEETPAPQETDEGQEANAAGEASANLLETNWLLAMLADSNDQLQPVIPGTELGAEFNMEGRVSGSAGCNDFASNYSSEGRSLSITIPAMTRKSCVEPKGIMIQETNFLSKLTAVTTYQIDGSELQLFDNEGNVILVFKAQ